MIYLLFNFINCSEGNNQSDLEQRLNSKIEIMKYCNASPSGCNNHFRLDQPLKRSPRGRTILEQSWTTLLNDIGIKISQTPRECTAKPCQKTKNLLSVKVRYHYLRGCQDFFTDSLATMFWSIFRRMQNKRIEPHFWKAELHFHNTSLKKLKLFW